MLTIESWDDRRDYIIAGDEKEAIDFSVDHWIHSAKRAIQQRGKFAVALSGGSTPKAIYAALSQKAGEVDWSNVWVFWSDERALPPDHPDSNYRMAMENGIGKLPIPPHQIFRMQAEKEIEKNALDYEEKIHHYLGKHLFDLVMLGVGEDGHTASLFPNTAALQENKRLVIPNYIPEKKSWRMTFSFPCINQSFHSVIYALGASKSFIIPKILEAPIDSPFPASRIGTEKQKCLLILDNNSSCKLK